MKEVKMKNLNDIEELLKKYPEILYVQLNPVINNMGNNFIL